MMYSNETRIEMQVRDFLAASAIDHEAIRNAKVRVDDLGCFGPLGVPRLRLMLRAQLVLQPLDKLQVTVPADWRSHLLQTIGLWADGKVVYAGGKWVSLWAGVARWCHKRVKLRQHTLEVMRAYPDITVPDQARFTTTWFDGQMVGQRPDSKWRSEFDEARARLEVAMAADRETTRALTRVLQLAERGDWRTALGGV